MMNDAQDNRSISQIIRDAGYDHRSTGGIEHEIYRVDTGERIGFMSADRAVQWLIGLGLVVPEALQ